MRKLHALLAAWCVLAILPGLAVMAGVFGELHIRWHGARIDNDSIPLGAIFAWIAGYLVQFGVFMWAMRVSRKPKILAFLVASTVPFLNDWAPLAGSTWNAVPFQLVTVGTALWIATAARRSDELARDGVPARGIVLAVIEPAMNVVINNVYLKRKLRLRIERDDDAPPYEGLLDGTFMIGNIPSVGDAIRLRVDPKRPQRFEATEPAEASTAKPGRQRASSHRSGTTEELEHLVRLRDRGALTEAEFTAAKRKILGEP
jgi:hypothetical protein